MRRRTFGALIGTLVIGGGALAAWDAGAAAGVAPYVTAAVADSARPKADTDRDADRKPAEMLAFAGVKPGSKMAEILPGGGYFTRIFSKAVGPQGHVFAIINPPADPSKPPPIVAIAADTAYANVTIVSQPLTSFSVPEPVDIVWTSQNYHDLHLKRYNLDISAVNKDVFNALKPGGVYVVLDHSALPGEPIDAADRYHRIDPAIVRKEVEAAGFVFVGEDDTLRNSNDPKNVPVFDPSIRGHTDQFIYKFRKPG